MSEEKLKEVLEKRIIKKAEAIKNTKTGQEHIELTLDNGCIVKILMKGGPGADSNWYEWLVIEANNQEIFRGF